MQPNGRKQCLNCIIFLFQSEVMSAGFAKFHPNLVVGGTYSGQIVLWDNRSNKRTPVQRTPLSAAAHTVMHGSSHSFVPTHTLFFLCIFTSVLGFLGKCMLSNSSDCALLLCSASSLLCERGRNPKRKQPDQHFH